MNAAVEARAYLAKARELLESATDDRDLERFTAATSAAVHCGINAKEPSSIARADAVRAVQSAARVYAGAEDIVARP